MEDKGNIGATAQARQPAGALRPEPLRVSGEAAHQAQGLPPKNMTVEQYDRCLAEGAANEVEQRFPGWQATPAMRGFAKAVAAHALARHRLSAAAARDTFNGGHSNG
jgi:hypothetical protein